MSMKDDSDDNDEDEDGDVVEKDETHEEKENDDENKIKKDDPQEDQNKLQIDQPDNTGHCETEVGNTDAMTEVVLIPNSEALTLIIDTPLETTESGAYVLSIGNKKRKRSRKQKTLTAKQVVCKRLSLKKPRLTPMSPRPRKEGKHGNRFQAGDLPSPSQMQLEDE